MHLGALLILTVIGVQYALGGTSSKVIFASRTDRPPTLDGFLNEPQWQNAQPALDFTQFDPVEGALPTEQTSVRILYDDRALYVGVICYDSKPDQIVKQLTRRDRTSEADRFTVQIDSYHDLQTAFVFSANVSGVQSDGVLSQDGAVYDITFDAVWEAKTAIYDDGWSVEFEIPFNALRFTEQDDGEFVWGINFRRYISRKHETIEWVMIPRSERLQISRWGTMRGLKDIKPPLHLNLTPYASGTSTFHAAGSGWSDRSSQSFSAGVDVKYGVTRNFTIDASVNPDFGQVEVDQAVLNLTVFETLYPEKRPFFVEGAQLFTFGVGVDNTSMPLFFSRRIGKRPSGAPFVFPPPGGSVRENPALTTILGAAKISGRTDNGLSVGALTAMTDEETAIVRDSSGHEMDIRTEPRGSYNVVRLKQEFGGDSWIGGLASAVSHESVAPTFSGGLDWNLRFGNGEYAIDGYAARTRGLDRDGSAGRLLLSRIAADHWLYTTSYDFSSRHFDPNDIGFFAQPRDHGGYAQLLYRENFADGIFRRYSVALNPEYRWNWDGVFTHKVLNVQYAAEFKNFWQGQLLYSLALPAYDDAEQGIVGTYLRPLGHTISVYVKTDERKDVSASLLLNCSINDKGKQSAFAQLGMTVRPASWMEFTPAVLYGTTRKEEAWVFGTRPVTDLSVSTSPFSVFGNRDVDQLDLELRGIVTFTRALSLQFFSQVFLARGRYADYKGLVSSTELIPYPAFSPVEFNRVVLNANVLLRWEYLPGSTMYLVWTQGRVGDNGLYTTRLSERFRDAFSLPHEDVVFLKLNYWLPL